jgi:hypothetical protein
MNPIELKFHFSPFPLLAPVGPSRFNDLTIQRFNVAFASQAQSNPVKPNQATPPLAGKEIGKETVNFLAIFDHPIQSRMIAGRFLTVTNAE